MQTKATAENAGKPISRKHRQRALAAARQARRSKRGIAAVIRVEAFEHEIDALIRAG